MTIQNREKNSKKIERLQFGFSMDNWRRYMKSKLSRHIVSNVLEVGSGVGSTTNTFYDESIKSWTSIEPNIKLYKQMEKNQKKGLISKNIKLSNCYLNETNKTKFNTIMYIDVLEHIENDKYEVKIASSKIQKNGKIIILCPAYNFLYSRLDYSVGHYRRYTKDQLFNLFDKEKFELQGFYLDSIGIIANLLNKYLIKSSSPTKIQYFIFNYLIIPISIVTDKLFNYSFGRSVVVIAKKN